MHSNFSFAHSSEFVKYKDKFIKTYTFGEGKNVALYLPSFPQSGIAYLLFLRNKQNLGLKFITFDLPGWIGYSENIFNDKKFNFDEILNIAEYILDYYKVKDFNIIGYSFGGALSLKIASKFKSRVKRIVLISTIINPSIISNLSTPKFVKYAYRLGLSKFVGIVIRKYANRMIKDLRSQNVPSVMIQEYVDMISKMNNKIVLDSAYNLFTSDFTKDLLDLKDKEFMILNSKDENKMFRIQAEYMRRILHGENSIYLNGTHDDVFLHPDSNVVNKVLEFLSK